MQNPTDPKLEAYNKRSDSAYPDASDGSLQTILFSTPETLEMGTMVRKYSGFQWYITQQLLPRQLSMTYTTGNQNICVPSFPFQEFLVST
jgi:hypothetical protein